VPERVAQIPGERQCHAHCSKQRDNHHNFNFWQQYIKHKTPRNQDYATNLETMAPSKANNAEYSKDEKVLCFHLELLYEAKVLDVKPKDPNDKGDGYVYKIHYKGWKNT
jgi:hypothetical protein